MKIRSVTEIVIRQRARQIIKLMAQKGIQPDIVTISSLNLVLDSIRFEVYEIARNGGSK